MTADPPYVPGFLAAFFPAFIDVTSAAQSWIGRSMSARAQIAGKDGEPEAQSFTSGEALLRLSEAYASWDGEAQPYAQLGGILNETLVTAGDNDLIVPTENSFALVKAMPRASFVVYPGSGHGHLFQYGEFYVSQVRGFLDGEWPTHVPAFGAIFGKA
jgi:pimeloyl-ACP methyl ester carboxylesterase